MKYKKVYEFIFLLLRYWALVCVIEAVNVTFVILIKAVIKSVVLYVTIMGLIKITKL